MTAEVIEVLTDKPRELRLMVAIYNLSLTIVAFSDFKSLRICRDGLIKVRSLQSPSLRTRELGAKKSNLRTIGTKCANG